MRAVVSVATGPYLANQDRLRAAIPQENALFWRNVLPPGSPSHLDTPYAFKAYAIRDALRQGAQTVLWMDASVLPIRPLEPLWQLIEEQGYWFSLNLPCNNLTAPAWNCGQWTCDSALEPLEITREEAFGIPHVIGTAFGLDLRDSHAQLFFDKYMKLVQDDRAFRGPWTNNDGWASKDRRVLGHRHDQTVASVLAWRLGMKLTRPPKWIVDGGMGTEETVLTIQR